MATVGAYEAKTHLSELLERVANGETITITKHGTPVAVLVPPSHVPKRDIDEVIAEIREFRKQVKPDPEGWTVKQYVELGRR
ncbi:MAG TPA: type II toxin-antitoxin system prevent-host-death family antitoxin [Chloroflexota bacterium]|nr:type II toxin-antitoxin system prevent-host-death family antitoxin [Chloroflexota bacterium]